MIFYSSGIFFQLKSKKNKKIPLLRKKNATHTKNAQLNI